MTPKRLKELQAVPADELFARWRQYIDLIAGDIQRMFIAKRTFEDVREIFFKKHRRLLEIGPNFYLWMHDNYVAAILMYFRSQVDTQPGAMNLHQLMDEIENRPDVITANRLGVGVAATSDWMRKTLVDGFKERWTLGGKDASADAPLDSTRIASDRRRLSDGLQRIDRFASTTIAHRVLTPPIDGLSVGEVNEAFKLLGEIFQDYYLLVTGIALAEVEPMPVFDTHAIFREAWLPDSLFLGEAEKG